MTCGSVVNLFASCSSPIRAAACMSCGCWSTWSWPRSTPIRTRFRRLLITSGRYMYICGQQFFLVTCSSMHALFRQSLLSSSLFTLLCSWSTPIQPLPLLLAHHFLHRHSLKLIVFTSFFAPSLMPHFPLPIGWIHFFHPLMLLTLTLHPHSSPSLFILTFSFHITSYILTPNILSTSHSCCSSHLIVLMCVAGHASTLIT